MKLGISQVILFVAPVWIFCGCATQGVKNPSATGVTVMNADEEGFVAGTGVESQDLVAITDKMARSVLQTPLIAQSPTPPIIVVEPVKNNTRFPVNKELFTMRIRALLNQRATGKIQFIAREHMDLAERERAMKRSGQVTSASDPNRVEFKGADYFLTGVLSGMSTSTSRGTSDYILYTFQLFEAKSMDLLWEDFAEIKKQALEDAVYR